MRIALLSDMHGNAVAFRAALADVQRRDVDLIVSLGDVAQGGPQPVECVALLRELGCPCVSGNSDEFLLTLDLGAEAVDDQQRERLLEVARWSRDRLGEDGREFLRRLEPTVELDAAGAKLLCCHATPVSNEDVILPETPRAEVERMIGEPVADAVAVGHVHLQWLRRFSHLLWFCVGSVGLVYEHKEPLDEVPFEPWSEYAVLTADDGRFAVEFRRVRFEVEQLLGAARATDFPDVERWAAMWKR